MLNDDLLSSGAVSRIQHFCSVLFEALLDKDIYLWFKYPKPSECSFLNSEERCSASFPLIGCFLSR